jgi:hypothetical protein
MVISNEKYDSTVININNYFSQLKTINEEFEDISTTLNTNLVEQVSNTNELLKTVFNQINELQNEVNTL